VGGVVKETGLYILGEKRGQSKLFIKVYFKKGGVIKRIISGDNIFPPPLSLRGGKLNIGETHCMRG